MLRKTNLILIVLGLILCLGSALTAAERDVIYRGVDLWYTPDNERSSLDFSENPIPAGFFCSRSDAFAGRLSFRGEPLETSPAGVFGNADTIVERLDNAVFNEQGVAQTRIQVRALSMVGTAPIRTACGVYSVTVGLDGEQPVTTMRIVHDSLIGGYFLAPLEINVKLSFWPVGPAADLRSGPNRKEGDREFRPLQLVQRVSLGSNPQSGWTFYPGSDGVVHQELTRVDIDGDGVPETEIQGTSNFATGWWDAGGTPTRRNIYMFGLTQNQDLAEYHGTKHSVRAPSYAGVKGGKK